MFALYPLVQLFIQQQNHQNAHLRFSIFRVYFAVLSLVLIFQMGFMPSGILSVVLSGKWPWMLFKWIHIITLCSLMIGLKTRLMQWINLCLLLLMWPFTQATTHSALMGEIHFALFALALVSFRAPLSMALSVDSVVKKVQKYASNRPHPISILLIFSLFQMTYTQGLIDQILMTNLSKIAFISSTLIFICVLPSLVASLSWLLIFTLNLAILATFPSFQIQSLIWINLGYLLLWLPDLWVNQLRKLAHWSYGTPEVSKHLSKITLFYDGDCGVCSLAARTVSALDQYQLIKIDGSTQNDYPQNHYLNREAFEETRLQTIIVWDQANDQIDVKHLGFAQIFFRLQGFYCLGLLCLWSGRIGEWAYDHFAQRRHLVSHYLGMGYCGIGGGKTKAKVEQLSLFEQTLVWIRILMIEGIGIWSLVSYA